ncbi:MAG: peptidase M10 [Bacteroidota bacterium]|nr:peptidase M10 [Ferruginibacter sp.]
MGEVEINTNTRQVIIHSAFFFYGTAADEIISRQVSLDIATHWNEAMGTVIIKGTTYGVHFNIEGNWVPGLVPETIFENINPRYNYFRIEAFAETDISFVDAIGSNTGYFKLDNLLNNSTTAAHEYGHTLGLKHPRILDTRGQGVPGIMYPRGTICDPAFQYNPLAAPLEAGGTINPFCRRVLQADIDRLRLTKLNFDRRGFATIGEFTSIWHERHLR